MVRGRPVCGLLQSVGGRIAAAMTQWRSTSGAERARCQGRSQKFVGGYKVFFLCGGGGIKLQYSCSIAVLKSFLPRKKFTWTDFWGYIYPYTPTRRYSPARCPKNLKDLTLSETGNVTIYIGRKVKSALLRRSVLSCWVRLTQNGRRFIVPSYQCCTDARDLRFSVVRREVKGSRINQRIRRCGRASADVAWQRTMKCDVMDVKRKWRRGILSHDVGLRTIVWRYTYSTLFRLDPDVTLDKHLTFDDHVRAVCKSAYTTTSGLCVTFALPPPRTWRSPLSVHSSAQDLTTPTLFCLADHQKTSLVFNMRRTLQLGLGQQTLLVYLNSYTGCPLSGASRARSPVLPTNYIYYPACLPLFIPETLHSISYLAFV